MGQTLVVPKYSERWGMRWANLGKAGRSISVVCEHDRKLLKEIVNSNANRTLKQRLVAPGQFRRLFSRFHRFVPSERDSLSLSCSLYTGLRVIWRGDVAVIS